MIGDASAEIRIKHLPNKSLRYILTNRFVTPYMCYRFGIIFFLHIQDNEDGIIMSIRNVDKHLSK
jgi:hypothetical protein